MSAENEIPRKGPASEDGAGTRSLHEQWERDARTIAARFNAKPEPSEQLALDDSVICPECGGGSPSCPCCKGRALVSPLYADTWLRQGA